MALTQTQVSKLYVSVFGRASEGEGNTYWQTDQPDMVTSADVMLATDAATTYFGTSLATNQAFIEHIYSNTLGKTITDDPTGVAYWTAELDAGKSRGEVVTALVTAAVTTANAGNAQDQFNNKVEVSDYTATNIQTFTDAATFQGYISSVTHETSTVTAAKTSVDTNAPAATYTLAADLTTVTEGSVVTFTVTASKAATADTTLNFQMAGVEIAGGTADPATDLGKVTGQVTIAAGATTATFTLTPTDDGVTEGFEGFNVSLLDSALATVATSGNVAIQDGAEAGQTFTLTTATDTVTGTTGSDTVIGEVSGTPALNTVNAADQIDGGAGTDMYKIFGAFTAGTSNSGNITNIETLHIAQTAAANQIFSSFTKAATGIDKIEIADASLLNTHAITTTTGQTLSLATGALNTHTAGAVTWTAPTTDTSLDLILNGYQGGTTAVPVALTITAAGATTQNIASTGAANAVSTFTLGAVTNKVVVTGDQKFTVNTSLVSSGGATILKTFDASAATGGANIVLAAATNAAFTFTGGTGDDSIKLADDGMAALTSGAQLDGGAGTADKLGLLDTALTAAEITAINAAQNFEILGLNAAITADGSAFTSIKNFSLDTNAVQSIVNMKTGAIVDITAAHAANASLGGAVGVSDVTVNVGTSTSTGLTVGGNLTVGQTTVALTSNGASGTNTITNLVNADNSTYTITGSSNLTISTMAATTTGSKVDASGFTGVLTITGNATAFATGSGLGDILIGGSANDIITSSVNGATMTGNAGNDAFNVSVALGGVAATAMMPVITDFTKGDSIIFANKGTEVFTTTKVDSTSFATAAAGLDALCAGDGSTNGIVKWFQFGTDTYVVNDQTAGATFAATDFAVKLTGLVDLSTSTFDTVTLTFA